MAPKFKSKPAAPLAMDEGKMDTKGDMDMNEKGKMDMKHDMGMHHPSVMIAIMPRGAMGKKPPGMKGPMGMKSPIGRKLK
jgi:hypothetical protein